MPFAKINQKSSITSKTGYKQETGPNARVEAWGIYRNLCVDIDVKE